LRASLHLNGAGLALEPVRHVNLVLLVVVAVCQNISTLESLVEVAEDVVDDDNGLCSFLGASDVLLQKVSVSCHWSHKVIRTYMSCNHQFPHKSPSPGIQRIRQEEHCSMACCGLV
jgi:hypothetical protein